MVRYRQVRFHDMKIGIANEEAIISQAHSRYLRLYMIAKTLERCKQKTIN